MPKVLVVDDDFAVTEVTRIVLEHEGFVVDVASNGEHALRMVARGAPDVIVTDLMMPILDGAKLVRELRRGPASQSIPVILITATPAPDLAAADGDYACILAKPVTVTELLAAIRRVLS